MKSKIGLALLLLAVSASVYADTLQELISKGCPSPDREWRAKDYAAVEDLLVKKLIPLPRLNSDSGRLIMHRLVDTENLSFHHDRSIPLNMRMDDLLKMSGNSEHITMIYVREANTGEKIEKELADLLVYQLAVSSTMIDLVEEFLPTIPKDEKNKTRLAGVAEIKSGLTTVLDGTIVSLTERKFYSDESVEKMIHGIREYYPRFDSILPETAKLEFRVKIDGLIAKETSHSVKQELLSLKHAMETNPAATTNSVAPLH